MKKHIYFFVIMSLIFLTSCSPSKRFSKGYSIEEGLYSEYDRLEPLEISEGIASYYGRKHDGKKTASGEIFNANRFTASHHTYPFGTIVRVTNFSNDHSVLLKVNDRMPVYNKRIIDISLKAAKELNMVRIGTARVKIEVLKWGS